MVDFISHFRDRHLQPERYSVHWDDETACFVLFNLSGEIVGYQRYRPFAPKVMRNDEVEGRYYTYYTGDKHNKRFSVWGLESFSYDSRFTFVTEGIFDACRFHNFGWPAIAVLSNDPKYLRNWLYIVGQQRKLITVCDGDDAGRRLAKFGHTSFICPVGIDVGDATDQWVFKTGSSLIEKVSICI